MSYNNGFTIKQEEFEDQLDQFPPLQDHAGGSYWDPSLYDGQLDLHNPLAGGHADYEGFRRSTLGDYSFAQVIPKEEENHQFRSTQPFPTLQYESTAWQMNPLWAQLPQEQNNFLPMEYGNQYEGLANNDGLPLLKHEQYNSFDFGQLGKFETEYQSFQEPARFPRQYGGATRQIPQRAGLPIERQPRVEPRNLELMPSAFPWRTSGDGEVTEPDREPKQEEVWVKKEEEEEDDEGSEQDEESENDEENDGDDDEDDEDDDDYDQHHHFQRLVKTNLPFEPYAANHQFFDEDGNPVDVDMTVTPQARFGEDNKGGHSYWVQYRRNYFGLKVTYHLKPTRKVKGPLCILRDDKLIPVHGLYLTVRGIVDRDTNRDAEIIIFDSKRKPVADEPPTLPVKPRNHRPVFAMSMDGVNYTMEGYFRRMQWRQATNNNGSRRSKQSLNNLLAVLSVQVETPASIQRTELELAHSTTAKPRRAALGLTDDDGEDSLEPVLSIERDLEMVQAGYCISGPLQVRGRCPQSFEEYEPENPEHKRRKPNHPKPKSRKDGRGNQKKLEAPRHDSRTRISKSTRESGRSSRQTRQQSFRPLAVVAPTPVHTPLRYAYAPAAPMMARTGDEMAMQQDELDGYHGDVSAQIEAARDNGEGHPDTALDWLYQFGQQ